MVTSGTIIRRVVFFSLFFLPYSHFWLVRVHWNAHLYPKCRLNRPGGSCYRSKHTSPSPSPPADVLNFTALYLAYIRHTLIAQSSLLSLRSPRLRDSKGSLSLSPRAKAIRLASVEPIHPTLPIPVDLCAISLSTTLLSEPYHDANVMYPTASDKWGVSQ